MADITGARKVIVCRHGERVDFTFGEWIKLCCDDSGKYTRKDLNMPKSLPARKGSPDTYRKDSPLTNVGLLQAELIGNGMKDSELKINHVFVSPSYRCVQTATNILKGLGVAKDMPLNIEPGLFEWMGWYSEYGMPSWMTAQELQDAGYNINASYQPLTSLAEMVNTEETCEMYYERNFQTTKSLIEKTKAQGGNILLVGHAATLDTCTRQLTGKSPLPAKEMLPMLREIPYCSVAMASQDSSGKWVLEQPPFPSMTNTANKTYDWKVLQTKL